MSAPFAPWGYATHTPRGARAGVPLAYPPLLVGGRQG